MKDDRIYLRHMMECIRRIEENTAAGGTAFSQSHTLQDAVLRNLQTLAESTQRLSDTTKLLRPDVPWAEIAGFRNVVVHDYLGIDLDVIWDITQEDVPALRAAVAALLDVSTRS